MNALPEVMAVEGTERQFERTAARVSECAALRIRELDFVMKALHSRK